MQLAELRDAVIEGNPGAADELTRRAIAEGIAPTVTIDQALMPAMTIVGDKFKRDEYYLPDVLVSVRAMKAAMALIKPLLARQDTPRLGRVLLATVKGDLHDLGKNLVGTMLEAAGFEVIDLGTNIAPDALVAAVKTQKPQLVGLSSLLTTTMPMLKKTIDRLEDAQVRDQVKVMVGGAPVTREYAASVGADGYASEAPSAVDLARSLLGTSGQIVVKA